LDSKRWEFGVDEARVGSPGAQPLSCARAKTE
jgi:hypothetical protein